jgi:hypothetical protein
VHQSPFRAYLCIFPPFTTNLRTYPENTKLVVECCPFSFTNYAKRTRQNVSPHEITVLMDHLLERDIVGVRLLESSYTNLGRISILTSTLMDYSVSPLSEGAQTITNKIL